MLFSKRPPCTGHLGLPFAYMNFLIMKQVSLAPLTMRKPSLRETEKQVKNHRTYRQPNQDYSPEVAETLFPPPGTW